MKTIIAGFLAFAAMPLLAQSPDPAPWKTAQFHIDGQRSQLHDVSVNFDAAGTVFLQLIRTWEFSLKQGGVGTFRGCSPEELAVLDSIRQLRLLVGQRAKLNVGAGWSTSRVELPADRRLNSEVIDLQLALIDHQISELAAPVPSPVLIEFASLLTSCGRRPDGMKLLESAASMTWRGKIALAEAMMKRVIGARLGQALGLPEPDGVALARHVERFERLTTLARTESQNHLDTFGVCVMRLCTVICNDLSLQGTGTREELCRLVKELQGVNFEVSQDAEYFHLAVLADVLLTVADAYDFLPGLMSTPSTAEPFQPPVIQAYAAAQAKDSIDQLLSGDYHSFSWVHVGLNAEQLDRLETHAARLDGRSTASIWYDVAQLSLGLALDDTERVEVAVERLKDCQAWGFVRDASDVATAVGLEESDALDQEALEIAASLVSNVLPAPVCTELMYLLARYFRQNGEQGLGAHLARLVTTVDSSSPLGWLEQGIVRMQRAEPQQVINGDLDRAIALAGLYDWVVPEALYCKGLVAWDAGDLARASDYMLRSQAAGLSNVYSKFGAAVCLGLVALGPDSDFDQCLRSADRLSNAARSLYAYFQRVRMSGDVSVEDLERQAKEITSMGNALSSMMSDLLMTAKPSGREQQVELARARIHLYQLHLSVHPDRESIKDGTLDALVGEDIRFLRMVDRLDARSSVVATLVAARRVQNGDDTPGARQEFVRCADEAVELSCGSNSLVLRYAVTANSIAGKHGAAFEHATALLAFPLQSNPLGRANSDELGAFVVCAAKSFLTAASHEGKSLVALERSSDVLDGLERMARHPRARPADIATVAACLVTHSRVASEGLDRCDALIGLLPLDPFVDQKLSMPREYLPLAQAIVELVRAKHLRAERHEYVSLLMEELLKLHPYQSGSAWPQFAQYLEGLPPARGK